MHVENETPASAVQKPVGKFLSRSLPSPQISLGWTVRIGFSFFTTKSNAAMNLGDDADTTGAVCGQIAGAFYGMSGIPARWREKLARREEIMKLAADLCALAHESARGIQQAS